MGAPLTQRISMSSVVRDESSVDAALSNMYVRQCMSFLSLCVYISVVR
jgi:hypothetical protein